MVTLYVWSPKPVESVQQGLAPDVGHASVEWSDGYASFWPEPQSLIGALTNLFKRRPARAPASYSAETDPDLQYMQRTADFAESADDFDEAPMLQRWRELAPEPYDFRERNCSHVALELLRAGLLEAERERLGSIDRLTEAEPDSGDPVEDALQKARVAAAAPATSCTPEKVRMLLLAVLRERGGSVHGNAPGSPRRTLPCDG